jgi:hypothetical protein
LSDRSNKRKSRPEEARKRAFAGRSAPVEDPPEGSPEWIAALKARVPSREDLLAVKDLDERSDRHAGLF